MLVCTLFQRSDLHTLQALLTRLDSSSILRRATVSPEELQSADLSLLKEKQAIDLIRALSSWPDVFSNTLKTLEPVYVSLLQHALLSSLPSCRTTLSYLFKMSHSLSSSYDVLQVIGSEPELMKARLALYVAARQVLNNGMRLLGLSPLDR
jgi:arginyl-tRNA synthetase